jgi:hypothetical protein
LSSVSSTSTTSSIGGKFVDPLVLRRQKDERGRAEGVGATAKGRGKGKVAVGQLVAFFDEKTGG